MKKPKVKVTKTQLRHRILEAEAQQAHVYHFASAALHKTSTNNLMGSGVLLQLTALGGHELIEPVVIRDGLSAETIAAIRADLVRSFELATAFKPRSD